MQHSSLQQHPSATRTAQLTSAPLLKKLSISFHDRMFCPYLKGQVFLMLNLWYRVTEPMVLFSCSDRLEKKKSMFTKPQRFFISYKCVLVGQSCPEEGDTGRRRDRTGRRREASIPLGPIQSRCPGSVRDWLTGKSDSNLRSDYIRNSLCAMKKAFHSWGVSRGGQDVRMSVYQNSSTDFIRTVSSS